MKYKDISWNLIINDEQASCNDETLDFIAEEIQKGNTSGFFTTDCTDYNRIDELKEQLEKALGRDVDFNVESDNIGELEDILQIAEDNKDYEIYDIVKEILEIGFEN